MNILTEIYHTNKFIDNPFVEKIELEGLVKINEEGFSKDITKRAIVSPGYIQT